MAEVVDVVSVEETHDLDLPNLKTIVLQSSPWHLPFADLIRSGPNLETLGAIYLLLTFLYHLHLPAKNLSSHNVVVRPSGFPTSALESVLIRRDTNLKPLKNIEVSKQKERWKRWQEGKPTYLLAATLPFELVFVYGR